MEDEVLDQTGGAADPAEEIVEQTQDDTGGAVVDDVKDEAIEPAFTPDYKFNANKVEMEIPEEFRAHIKDVESQKKVKEMFEKYHGFDAQKEQLKTYEQDVVKYRGEYEQLAGSISDIQAVYRDAVQSKNPHKLDLVWKKLGIGEDVVMAYAFEKAKLAEMDPQSRSAVERQIQLEQEAYERKSYENSLMTENQQKDLTIRQMQYDSAMASPQIQGFATELDSKFGMDGLFAQEVVNAGKTAYALEGKILSVPEAISAVISKFGLKGQAQQVQTPQQTPQKGNLTADGKQVVKRETKTIPNVGSSGGASPVGAGKAKNLDDVRKKYQELISQGS